MLLALTIFTSPSYAVDKKSSPTKPTKPEELSETPRRAINNSLMLLPVTGKGVNGDDLMFYRTTMAQALSKKYTVKYGKQVDDLIKEIFDESKCYRDSATALDAERVGKASIIKDGNDYRISLEVYNVFENKSEYAKTDVCTACNQKALISALIELSASSRNAGLGFVSSGTAQQSGETKVELDTLKLPGTPIPPFQCFL
jgi:hypothetical protein